MCCKQRAKDAAYVLDKYSCNSCTTGAWRLKRRNNIRPLKRSIALSARAFFLAVWSNMNQGWEIKGAAEWINSCLMMTYMCRNIWCTSFRDTLLGGSLWYFSPPEGTPNCHVKVSFTHTQAHPRAPTHHFSLSSRQSFAATSLRSLTTACLVLCRGQTPLPTCTRSHWTMPTPIDPAASQLIRGKLGPIFTSLVLSLSAERQLNPRN